MAAYPIPNPQYGIYNQNNFSPQTTGQSSLTIDEGKKYFLTFPNAQTTQTEFLNNIGVGGSATFEGPVTFNDIVEINEDITLTKDVIVDGTVTIGSNLLCESTATVTDTLTCENGIDISTVGTGLTFPDNTTQTTAFIEANYAQLNTDNTFLAPYKQIFQQNSSTVPSTSPIQINNITNSDNIAFYIDPSAGNDLTLYSSQATGGLTVRTPSASFTLNPVTVSPGIVGAQSLNPIDMNGNGLFGLVNVYADGASTTFCDSGTAPMLQLTNGGHTSYENLNMNNSTIYGASSVSSPLFLVGANGQIGNSATLNPQIMTIRNTAPNNTTPQIYFQMNDNTGTTISPMQILWNSVNLSTNIDMTTNTIKNCSALNGVSGGTLLLGTQQSVYVSISGGSLTAGNSLGINSANGNFIFNYYTANNLSLNMPGTAQTFYIQNSNGNIMTFSETEIDANKNLNMNNFSLLNAGQNSTAYTQPDGTNNTTIATTAFVANNSPIYLQSSFTNIWAGTSSISPTTVNVITTRIAATNIVSFNNVNVIINSNGGIGNTMLAQFQFNTNPWSTYPPASGSATSISVYCNTNGATYSCQTVWITSPPTLWISYPTGASTNAAQYTVNLSSFGAFVG